jgi:hypothetical protein
MILQSPGTPRRGFLVFCKDHKTDRQRLFSGLAAKLLSSFSRLLVTTLDSDSQRPAETDARILSVEDRELIF